ncbi:3-hexulose-6-phosphate isomerase [Isoptericola jiangsuensis]|uniref:3-hexulose-6-phosphate isomerase n=1 Tax=Isoptericola jiangsuensis TaxID=548579 RepID=A0A2A9F271_9MICO|nr:6-phospho-3-hexuloisomerase [Isoptericola jiangsuensis]PFG44555.1 3-hexulose-6-phosphate isomerase [Isoptericola jiangsuensis]
MLETRPAASAAVDTILDELHAVLTRVQHDQADSLDRLSAELTGARAVFVHGAGRSGIAVRGLAMRLMHLGLTAHVVGETTTPAIGTGDLLLAVSGSGTTPGVVRAAETAVAAGAAVAAITNDPGSPLAGLARVTVTVGAASKTDHSGTASAQYAGSLFEQAVGLLGDAVFHGLWQRSGLAAAEIWPRHANLE